MGCLGHFTNSPKWEAVFKKREFSPGEEGRLSFGTGSQNPSKAMKGKTQLKQEQNRAAVLGMREALNLRGWPI